MTTRPLPPVPGYLAWVSNPPGEPQSGIPDGTVVVILSLLPDSRLLVRDSSGHQFNLPTEYLDYGHEFLLNTGWAHESDERVLEELHRVRPTIGNDCSRTGYVELIERVIKRNEPLLRRRNGRSQCVTTTGVPIRTAR